MRKVFSAAVIAIASPAFAFDVTKYDAHVPDAQKQLIQAVEKARSDYAAAANDMARGGTRAVRAKAVCAALKGKSGIVWIGKVTKLSSSSEGHGVLSVSIGKDVTFKTWNNSFSDYKFATLIDPDSSLFEKVSKLKEGAIVKFTGKTFADKADCVNEASMTLGGSMAEPEYIFRFTDVKLVE
jgi:hypothetical protein